MKRPWILLILAGCASREEVADVPGTAIRMQLLRIEGKPGMPEFWMSARELTWAEFDRFCEFPQEEAVDGVTRPSRGKDYLALSGLPNEFMLPERPLTNVRYHGAIAYCEWLSRKTGATYRLPTEPEWLQACGENPGASAWVDENSGGRTHVGGERKPHASGVCDLLGNVWEYCLEPDRPPEFGPVLLGGCWNEPASARRRTLSPEWAAADPNRPLSTWWFRAGYCQGFRVVRVSDAAGKADRDGYMAKIEVGGMKGVERDRELYCRVSGTVRNGGPRILEELILKVYYLDPKGKPHVEDALSFQTRRATYNLAFPVLVSSAHPGVHAQPLKPGESREFTVDVPLTFDPDDSVDPARFGASVLSLRFAD